ncbi:hypothetical protein N3Z16_07245 [Candidatus Megaera polyxenophila]|uniref:hypothetical protein n=1 Tax=Candidatus Megaera polyxenophila TaxID=988779 RepID=UPI00249EACD8|nr:hypothetical protein N3Z16_07245 [Candidatus Megaera polyxenophila]
METEIYKYNQALVLSEARWKYSQYEKIVTNIGDLEKQQMLQERLEIEKNTVDTKLAANIRWPNLSRLKIRNYEI